MARKAWAFFWTLIFPILVIVGVALIADGLIHGDAKELAQQTHRWVEWIWGIVAALVLFVIIQAGHRGKREVFGAFIDSRNRYSLARVQVALWSVLVISAWLAIVIVRIAADVGSNQALNVDIPAAVLGALGISSGSWVVATGVKDRKSRRRTTVNWNAKQDEQRARLQSEIDQLATHIARLTTRANDSGASATARSADRKTLARLKSRLVDATRDRDAIDKVLAIAEGAEGVLARNASPSDADPSDIFLGEEVSDSTTTDFGKVQMFFVTVALVFAYGATVLSMMGSADLIANGTISLPDFSESLNGLLGISHAGYLGTKFVDSQPSQEAGTP
jgi:hypothetical protein